MVRGDGVVDRRGGRRPHAGGPRRPRRVRRARQRQLHRDPGDARGGRCVPSRAARGRGDLHGGRVRAGERTRRRLQRPPGTRLHERDDGLDGGGQGADAAAAARRRGACRGLAVELPARPGDAGFDRRRGGRARALRRDRGGRRRTCVPPRAGGAPPRPALACPWTCRRSPPPSRLPGPRLLRSRPLLRPRPSPRSPTSSPPRAARDHRRPRRRALGRRARRWRHSATRSAPCSPPPRWGTACSPARPGRWGSPAGSRHRSRHG